MRPEVSLVIAVCTSPGSGRQRSGLRHGAVRVWLGRRRLVLPSMSTGHRGCDSPLTHRSRPGASAWRPQKLALVTKRADADLRSQSYPDYRIEARWKTQIGDGARRGEARIWGTVGQPTTGNSGYESRDSLHRQFDAPAVPGRNSMRTPVNQALCYGRSKCELEDYRAVLVLHFGSQLGLWAAFIYAAAFAAVEFGARRRRSLSWPGSLPDQANSGVASGPPAPHRCANRLPEYKPVRSEVRPTLWYSSRGSSVECLPGCRVEQRGRRRRHRCRQVPALANAERRQTFQQRDEVARRNGLIRPGQRVDEWARADTFCRSCFAAAERPVLRKSQSKAQPRTRHHCQRRRAPADHQAESLEPVHEAHSMSRSMA